MTDRELEEWLFDTIQEGGYSFKELVDYAGRNSIKGTRLSKSLLGLLENGKIVVLLLNEEGAHETLDCVIAAEKLHAISEIAAQESNTKSLHYLGSS